MPEQDPVAGILMQAPATLRADAWDAFNASANADELASKIGSMNLPKEVKAQLWDLKQGSQSATTTPPPKPEKPNDSGSIAMRGAAASVSPMATGLETLAISPTAAKTIGAVARASTTIGGIVHGVATGNAPEVIMSPIAGWQAGKGGYWLGKGMQAVAGPVATAARSVAPYAQAVSTLAGAQGVNDLAQMAEPERKDIGFLGAVRNAPSDPDHPALLNLLAMKASDAIKTLIHEGMSLGEASKAYWNLKAKVD